MAPSHGDVAQVENSLRRMRNRVFALVAETAGDALANGAFRRVAIKHHVAADEPRAIDPAEHQIGVGNGGRLAAHAVGGGAGV